MIVLPGQDYTKGGEYTEEAELKSPDLTKIKGVLEDSQSYRAWYFNRNEVAFNAWHARWAGQTVDGRRWGADEEEGVWPWPGASDTRVHAIEKIIGEHMTVSMFAVMNMKLQGKSTRPEATMRLSQQITTLLQWTMFTQMQDHFRSELLFALNWRWAYGASLLEVVWEQERSLEYTTLTVPDLNDFIVQQTGDPARVDEFAALLADKSNDESMASVVQALSPIVTTAQARAIVRSLRELRYAEIPVPYVYKSRPRWTALRPMVDVFFPASTDLIQNARWIDRVERVTETELIDRIETEGYDADFVDQALSHKGSSSGNWRNTYVPGMEFNYNRGDYDELEEKIELHHFYRRVHDRGVPALYRTVFHLDVDTEAKHGPYGYDHNEYPLHVLRREHHERPILSSRGIPEIAYTWENEIKKQRDGRADMVDLSLRPPLMTNYRDVQRMKEQFMPGAIIPEDRNPIRFFNVPQYNAGSVEIEKTTVAAIEQFFALYGETVDPQLKQQRQQEVADAVLEELKMPVNQTLKLLQQFMPDDETGEIVGQLQRPFHLNRADIQHQFELSATVDVRENDLDFLKQKLAYIVQIAPLDHNGVIDWNVVVKSAFDGIDYTLADMAIQSNEQATQKEIDDEQMRLDLIIGSGRDQPLPQTGNFGLRLQTLQGALQEALQTNPATQKKIQDDPNILKVIENRMAYYQRQLQQQQNAQIGRRQVTQTFTKQAPALAAPMGM